MDYSSGIMYLMMSKHSFQEEVRGYLKAEREGMEQKIQIISI